MKLTISDGRSRFYQWDTGQILLLEGGENCDQVHFAQADAQRAIACPIQRESDRAWVQVPDYLLQTAQPFTAYLYEADAARAGTFRAQAFPVQARPRPENYVYEEPDTLTWESLDERIRELELTGGNGTVKSVNSIQPDAAGNVELELPAYREKTERFLAENVTVNKTEMGLTTVSWINYRKIMDYSNVTVVFDGVTYHCPVTVVESITQYGDESYYYIGNYRDNAPEYPFALWGYISHYFSVVIAETGTHQISLSVPEQIIHKLDPQYLPEELSGLYDAQSQLELLAGTDLLPAVQNGTGELLTDENANVILRY